MSMSNKQFRRLMKYHVANNNSPNKISTTRHGRRTVKNKASGVGQILRYSRIKPQVGLETVFVQHNKR